MRAAFSLLDEPWLPVQWVDGEVRSVGLIELVQRWVQAVALAESDPPALVAQYRLLLAIVQRALVSSLGEWQDPQRQQWFEQGLPAEPVLAYLEKWRDRFWLFHPERPFMQVAILDELPETRERCKPWTQISLASSSGNTPLVFDHSLDGDPAGIEPAEAARLLLGYLQFVPGGLVKVIKGSDNAGPLANSAAVMPVGSTLSESLCLGLHPSRPGGVEDIPAWEQTAQTYADLQAAPSLATGPNDRYTRLSRAVRLLRDEDGKVRWLRFAAGKALLEDPDLPDPMVSYRKGSNGLIRLGFVEGRALWRDLPALSPAAPEGSARAATIIDWAARLYRRVSQSLLMRPFWVAGVASDQAKLLRWRLERIRLPMSLLSDPDSVLELQAAIAKAETLFSELRQRATRMVAEALPDPHSKDTRSRARQQLDGGPMASTYYAGVQAAVPRWLALTAEGQWELAEKDWNQALRLSADAAWQQAVTGMGMSPRVLRAQALHQAAKQALLAGYILKPTHAVSEESMS